MEKLYLICAVTGGALLAFQLVMSFIGVGGSDLDTDADHGNGHHWGAGTLLGFLTVRNLIAGLTFFGLIGLAATSAGWSRPVAAAAAGGAGIVAMALMGLAMRGIMSLQDEGTIDIHRAVGQTGTVYLSVPGNKSGAGKVHVELQNRTAEYQAVTFQEHLPTGAKIVVVDVIGPDTVEVIAAPQYGRMTTNV